MFSCAALTKNQKPPNYVPAIKMDLPKPEDADGKPLSKPTLGKTETKAKPFASKQHKKNQPHNNDRAAINKKKVRNNIPKSKIKPKVVVAKANEKAKQEPGADDYFNGIVKYDYSEGILYQIYTSPKHITDIRLQRGESLNGSPCAGDTANWELVHTISGTGKTAQEHIIVKPVKPGLETNLVILTNKRIYYIDLKSSKGSYMAGVSWIYPDEKRVEFENKTIRKPIGPDLSLNDLNFNYKIAGNAPYKPIAVFDDKKKTFIQFRPDIAQSELPPLFVLSNEKQAQLVNYRYSVENNYYVIDMIFEAAMLKMGKSVVYIYNISLKKRHSWLNTLKQNILNR